MAGNLGRTSLKRKLRRQNPMVDYDQLPKELRAWIAEADLPWRPKSVRRTFDRALAQSGDRRKAIEELNRLQHRLVCKDARVIWGETHPAAMEQ